MAPEEFRLTRKALGMTQAELADAMGMSVRQIGAMERGQAEIRRITWMALLGLKAWRDEALKPGERRYRVAPDGTVLEGWG